MNTRRRVAVVGVFSMTWVAIGTPAEAQRRGRGPSIGNAYTPKQRTWVNRLCPGKSGQALNQCLMAESQKRCKSINEEASKVVGVDSAADGILRTVWQKSQSCALLGMPGMSAVQVLDMLIVASEFWDQIKGRRVKPKPTAGQMILSSAAQMWDSVKTGFNCGQMIDATMEFYRPILDKMRDLGAPVGTCAGQFLGGFFCNVQEFMGMLATLGEGVLQETRSCMALPVNRIPPGPVLCGIGRYIGKGMHKIWSCVDAMRRKGGNHGELMKLLLIEGFKAGCGIAGQTTFDALIAVMTGGVALPLIVAKWAAKIGKALERIGGATNASTWFKVQGKKVRMGRIEIDIGRNTVADAVQGYVQNTVKSLTECK